VRVYDNLENGHRAAIGDAEFIQGDLRTGENLTAALQGVEVVVHFAAYIEVGVGEKNPAAFYENNVAGTLRLLAAMRQAGVDRIVFSSTAAVYGEPQTENLSECHPKNPTSVYGRTKWMVEQMLADFDGAHGLRSACLRYFNACGADPAGEHGEDHDPESHLIPLVIQTALGQRSGIKLFGDDYPTPDGTCIRDYIHVDDLATAHEAAVEHLLAGAESRAFNLGTGRGSSVREVIAAVEQATGEKVAVEVEPRRAGDCSRLVADPAAIRDEWGWEARRSSLGQIVEDAVRWHRAHPNGYED
jgi:UDP-glucose 4-epimerase